LSPFIDSCMIWSWDYLESLSSSFFFSYSERDNPLLARMLLSLLNLYYSSLWTLSISTLDFYINFDCSFCSILDFRTSIYWYFLVCSIACFNIFLSMTACKRYAFILCSKPYFKLLLYFFYSIFRFPSSFWIRSSNWGIWSCSGVLLELDKLGSADD